MASGISMALAVVVLAAAATAPAAATDKKRRRVGNIGRSMVTVSARGLPAFQDRMRQRPAGTGSLKTRPRERAPGPLPRRAVA